MKRERRSEQRRIYSFAGCKRQKDFESINVVKYVVYSKSFQIFFCAVVDSLKFSMLLLYNLTYFYDFKFKWTATRQLEYTLLTI